MSEMGGGRRARPSSPELNRLRAEIDELDRRIVGLLNKRAELTRAVWHEKVAIGRRAIRDREREREVLLRVSIANEGPISQVDLLAIYRRLIAAARALETAERARLERDVDEQPEPPSACPRVSARRPGSRPRPPAGSISATSPTRSTSGASPGGSAVACCSGSRTTTANAASGSTTPR